MGRHDNIINMERPVDLVHQPMSLHNRAAQFAPFDALTGFGGRIWESSRITEQRIELGDERKLEINRHLMLLLDNIKERPEITVTYFVPDKTKDGGAYKTQTSRVCKIDEYEERVYLENENQIAFDDILTLDSDIFSAFFDSEEYV